MGAVVQSVGALRPSRPPTATTTTRCNSTQCSALNQGKSVARGRINQRQPGTQLEHKATNTHTPSSEEVVSQLPAKSCVPRTHGARRTPAPRQSKEDVTDNGRWWWVLVLVALVVYHRRYTALDRPIDALTESIETPPPTTRTNSRQAKPPRAQQVR